MLDTEKNKYKFVDTLLRLLSNILLIKMETPELQKKQKKRKINFKIKEAKHKNNDITASKYEIESPHQSIMQSKFDEFPRVDQNKRESELDSDGFRKYESINQEIKDIYKDFRLKNNSKTTKRSIFKVLDRAHVDHSISNQRHSQFSSIRDMSMSSTLQKRLDDSDLSFYQRRLKENIDEED